ncbi:MAG: 6-phosphogluconolactonase [Bacteroidota bacterium]
MDATLKVLSTKAQVARQFTEELLSWAADKDSVSIALSGGSTPKTLFKLWTEEYLDKFDWSKFTFYWGDERCVPPDDEESNYGAAYDLFLKHLPEAHRHIERMRGEDNPEQEAKRYANLIDNDLPKVENVPQFDVMLLGMGDDGHTASIFPNQMHLLTEEGFAATATHPDSGQTRVTLTGPVICQAKWIVFLVTGENKAARIQEIFTGQPISVNYPAAHIEAKEGEMTWYVDEAAAQALQS